MRNIFWITVLAIILMACGMQDQNKCTTADKSDTSDRPECHEPPPQTIFYLSGSISSAFGVKVDGVSYGDIEEFYTSAAENLTTQVEASGLAGYTAKFEDAALGFKDLTNDMLVFVSAIGNRGYATKTSVLSDDTFRASFPIAAAGDTYEVKATKKVSILATGLLSDGVTVDTKKFCWNFSAVALNVPYALVDKPVIISTFETSMTLKDCTLDSKGSFSVPDQQN